MINGFIVNKFRGDPALFADGMPLIAERTGWPGLGLVPCFPAAARLPAEDAARPRRAHRAPAARSASPSPILPRIANFDDLDPLAAEPDVDLVLRPPRRRRSPATPTSSSCPAPSPPSPTSPPSAPRAGTSTSRPPPPRRPRPRPLRRLPDARPPHRRPPRHRGPARRRPRPRPPRCRDRDRPRQAPRAGHRPATAPRPARHRLRDAPRPHHRPRLRPPVRPTSPTAAPTAPPPPTAASPAPTSTASSPTTAPARAWLARLGAAAGPLAYEAERRRHPRRPRRPPRGPPRHPRPPRAGRHPRRVAARLSYAPRLAQSLCMRCACFVHGVSMERPMPSGTLLYAQSGGVTAVINATASAVITAARAPQNQGARRPQRHPRRPARGSDRHLGEPAAAIRGLAHTPGGAFGSLPRQAQIAGRRPRALRAADRGAPGPRRALVPLQRRQRFGRHRAQGLAAGGRIRLPPDLHRRAQDDRQRPRRHRLLPRLRLGREIHRGLGPRSAPRRRRDGRHLDQGLRLRGDGPPRRLARRRRRPRRPAPPTKRRTSSCSPSAPSTRPPSSPRSTPSSPASAIASSSPAKASATADGSFVADAGAGKDAFGHTQLGGVASFLAGRGSPSGISAIVTTSTQLKPNRYSSLRC